MIYVRTAHSIYGKWFQSFGFNCSSTAVFNLGCVTTAAPFQSPRLRFGLCARSPSCNRSPRPILVDHHRALFQNVSFFHRNSLERRRKKDLTQQRRQQQPGNTLAVHACAASPRVRLLAVPRRKRGRAQSSDPTMHERYQLAATSQHVHIHAPAVTTYHMLLGYAWQYCAAARPEPAKVFT